MVLGIFGLALLLLVALVVACVLALAFARRREGDGEDGGGSGFGIGAVLAALAIGVLVIFFLLLVPALFLSSTVSPSSFSATRPPGPPGNLHVHLEFVDLAEPQAIDETARAAFDAAAIEGATFVASSGHASTHSLFGGDSELTWFERSYAIDGEWEPGDPPHHRDVLDLDLALAELEVLLAAARAGAESGEIQAVVTWSPIDGSPPRRAVLGSTDGVPQFEPTPIPPESVPVVPAPSDGAPSAAASEER